MRGVILYGPPASGKDTITRALHHLDDRYFLYPRLKCGGGKTTGYRMIAAAELDALRAAGDVIWENERYGSVYVVDRSALRRCLTDRLPVLHLGQVEAVDAVVTAFTEAAWLVVSLKTSREVAARRIEERGDTDARERMEVWDDTNPLPHADLVADTAEVTAAEAAMEIHLAVQRAELAAQRTSAP